MEANSWEFRKSVNYPEPVEQFRGRNEVIGAEYKQIPPSNPLTIEVLKQRLSMLGREVLSIYPNVYQSDTEGQE
jgi:hypothetical protein